MASDLRIGRHRSSNSKTLRVYPQVFYLKPNSYRGCSARCPTPLRIQAFKPPKSKEEKELELEAVQQRLLEEANSKRNAAIQQLRATFQRAPSTLAHTPAALSPISVSRVVSMSLRLTRTRADSDTGALSPRVRLAPSLTVVCGCQDRLARMRACLCRGEGLAIAFEAKTRPVGTILF